MSLPITFIHKTKNFYMKNSGRVTTYKQNGPGLRKLPKRVIFPT